MVKRAFDILMALIGLIVGFPILLLVAVAIAITDGLPVLFVQERVGLGGERFSILKFRTMRVVRSSDEFEPGQQSRVTAIGRLLRKSKLDELPQLWNVLVGQMSIVGPRPEVPQWVSVYPERWAAIHRVRPGITDPAAITYRNEEELLAASSDPNQAYREEILPRKLALYERYVESRSFFGDLGIILRTLVAVVLR